MELLINSNGIHIPLADKSVHCVVTSPPYYGKRKYKGEQGSVWPGMTYKQIEWLPEIVIPGDPDCEHVFGDDLPPHHPGQVEQTKWKDADAAGKGQTASSGNICLKCGAWRGELGLEPTPEMFVGHIVAIFREVWRVSRQDAPVFLNFGDSYNNHKGYTRMQTDGDMGWKGANFSRDMQGRPPSQYDIKNKDLMGIPWLIALALRADGWYLRNDPQWIKDSCMPESVTDRMTTAHEYLFLLSKSEHYYYDAKAVEMPTSAGSIARAKRGNSSTHKNIDGAPGQTPHSMNQARANDKSRDVEPGRNRRTSDVWKDSVDYAIAQSEEHLDYLYGLRDNMGLLLDTNGEPLALHVNAKGYKGSHFAVFPSTLVEPCVKAGSSEYGVCVKCGAPFERVMARIANKHNPGAAQGRILASGGALDGGTEQSTLGVTKHVQFSTLGWRPTCNCISNHTHEWDMSFLPSGIHGGVRGAFIPCNSCDARWYFEGEQWEDEPLTDFCVVPAIVFDPFVGSGTTLQVARALGRHGIGCDISFEYLHKNAAQRLGAVPEVFVTDDGEEVVQGSLFS